MPDLQLARKWASGCSLGDYIYIFGGTILREDRGRVDDFENTNKIERLNISNHRVQGAAKNRKASTWELFEASESLLPPRI